MAVQKQRTPDSLIDRSSLLFALLNTFMIVCRVIVITAFVLVAQSSALSLQRRPHA